MASQVVHCFTANGHGENKAKRTPVGVQVADANVGQELAERHDEEVQVEEKAKLFEQHQRQEREEVVFLQREMGEYRVDMECGCDYSPGS